MELVLYYSTGDPRMKKQEMMMKSVLVRMGVKIRNVAPDQVMESVGYLAGVPGHCYRAECRLELLSSL